jgi:NTP pyrophosphatase (non-canonical NTP hydrolase)
MTIEHMNDQQTNIKILKDLVQKFREKRGWTKEDPKDIAIGLSVEANEVLDLFQWEESKDLEKKVKWREALGDELADVMWYLIMMSNRLGLDLTTTLMSKIEKNEKKWSVKKLHPGMASAERSKEYYQIKAKYRGSHPLAEDL